MSRELVQLEDLLKWSERGLTGTGTEETEGEELVAEATLIREEANKGVQVRDEVWLPNNHAQREITYFPVLTCFRVVFCDRLLPAATERGSIEGTRY